MRRLGRRVALVALAALAGCGCATRPFSHDPLLRHGRGVWGDREKARLRLPPPLPEPLGPAAPPGEIARGDAGE
jgi:hypothetical protein